MLNQEDMAPTNEPVAIIGIALRGPGDASEPEKFWNMLLEARSARGPVPEDRYNVDGFYHPDPERLGSIQQRDAHFMKQDFKVFDAAFFSITPKEAKAMDPSHRMLLETTYEGFENAGLSLDDVSGTQTSCYVGIFTGDFPNLQARDNEGPSIYHATGLSNSLASNRLSWFYNLRGPSMTLDTACSSSLTAFHLACQSIRTGESEMSVVAGANLMFGPDMSILLGAAKILSPEGKSKMWDADANGFARGEGFGVTILKPLSAAIRDGDNIRAVVLASACNEDGRTPGLTMPNSEAQQELIQTAYRLAGVDPAETSYVEAHGTGTQTGDPLEARAILESIGKAPGRETDLYVGSVKTNIGHLEGAAGVLGVIKAAMVVERGLIPANLWFESLNPQIELPANVHIPVKLTTWPHDGPRRAGVNSFGFGGANAHVILQDAASYLLTHNFPGRHSTTLQSSLSNSPSSSGSESGYISDDSVESEKETSKLLLLSSNDQDGIKRITEQLQEYLSTKTNVENQLVKNMAYTLSSKRSKLPWKSYVTASTVSDLKSQLNSISAAVRSSNSAAPRVAFVFTGQGAQWHAMGKGLSAHKAYRDSMAKSELILRSFGCPWSLRGELDRSEDECKLRGTEYSQPACTALQVALVDLLSSWGITPVATVGHSSGEIAAAYTSGFLDHEAAIRISWLRGQVSATVSKNGGMLAASASAEMTRQRLDSLKSGKAVIACINSTKACTVSGDISAIDELKEALTEAQIPCTKLPMDVAYHSFHMETARSAYEEALAGTPHSSTQTVPMFSAVTGKVITGEEMKPSYWIDNLVSPVDFVGGVRALLHNTEKKVRGPFANLFVEIGPHSALRSYLLDIFSTEDRVEDFSYVSVLRRKFDGHTTAIAAAGQLWVHGCDVDIDTVNRVEPSVKMLSDLPPYPWNHSRGFWEESRISRQYRLRENPRSDLLGYRVPGSPEPQWRNFLRCSENPWIREHKVQGDILYPGAGILCMAIEAARQLALERGSEDIYGYEMRDVSLDTALRVPDTEKGIEVSVCLHPRLTGTRGTPSNTLFEFDVSSWSEKMNDWTSHARGLISVTYTSFLNTSMQQEVDLENQRYMERLAESKRICSKPARAFLYDNVETIGMVYGPTFRNVKDLHAGPETSYGLIEVPDTKAIMPKQFEYPFVIHPATLDSVLHLLFPSISDEEQSLSEAVVPRSFERIFVSAKIPTVPGSNLYGTSTAKKLSYTSWKSSIVVSSNMNVPAIIMEGLVLTSVGAGPSQQQETRALCFGQNWHEDFDLLAPAQIEEIVYQRTLKSKDDASVLDMLEYVCLVHIYKCLAWFETEDGKKHIPQDGFWKKYVQWMHDCVAQFPPLATRDEEVQLELQRCRERIVLSTSGDITVQMVDRIGNNLGRIFSREVEPLQCMTEGDLLYAFYRGAFGTSFNTNVAEYVGLIADKSPGLRILEIGAGTGGTTYHVLERLRNADGTSKAANYYFTDISPAFLAKASDRFSTDASIMQFATLNIENEPAAQGFELGSFDLVVAANVLHATKSIQETLTHCKSLLKPNGRLVLSEVTIKRIFSGFIMGPLPGWWLGEDDGRTGGPLMDVEEWDAALLKAGFSGVDMDIRGDHKESKEPVSLIISTAPNSNEPSVHSFVIISTGTARTDELASKIQRTIEAAGHKFVIAQWSTVTQAEVVGKYCICLAEWESPMLADLTDKNWETLQEVILSAEGTLWVTGGGSMDTPQPFKSLMVGLAHAIRNEYTGSRLAVLDLNSPEVQDLEEGAHAVLRVAVSHIEGDGSEGEFAARNGKIFVPRVERLLDVDASLRKYEAKGDLELVSFRGCGRPLKLSIKTPGLLDTFHWEEDETYYSALQPDWVEMEVKAVGLNFKDVLVALGTLAENKLGVDASGIVTRVGSAVTNVKVGDRVMIASCDTFATFVRFPAKGAIPIPDAMDWNEAASMPMIFLTAYYSLVTAGHLLKGEKILIHAAAGGVGQAAIILAQSIGAEIFATVGTEAKKLHIMQTYGIPEDHIFSSRDLSFVKGISRATSGQGVDVILNSLAGEALRLSWTDCLAKFGRFLEIGKADLFSNTGLDMKSFLDNQSYIGVNLLEFENNPTPRAVSLWQETANLIHSGSVKPVSPLQVFNMAEVEQAFRFMQAGKHMGKVIVRVDDDDMVMAIPRIPKVSIRADGTYVVAGLGGISKEIGRWLAEKGAKHLVFLSRSAASGQENKAFTADLEKTYGVATYAYDCDVGQQTALQSVLDDLKAKGVPKIRGCTTGAMVLHDTLFDAMTADHVRTTVGPKVHGTYNLHALLPSDLDFFIMLSSLAGVMGHRGQGNYGSGNIFQDAFASYRHSLGQHAMTIDIGYLVSVGFVADNEQYVEHVKSMGLKVMRTSDLHGLLAIAIEGNSNTAGQIMCGLPYNENDEHWYWIRDARFSGLRNLATNSSTGGDITISLREELIRCGKVDDESVGLITTAIAQRLANLMMIPAGDIDVARPLSAYGVDSLVAVEVRNWIAKEMGVECSVFDIMTPIPMRQLAADLAGKSKLLVKEEV